MKDVSSGFSPYGQNSLNPSPVNKMLSEITHDFRVDVDINLGVGYVDEGAIPYSYISSAVKKLTSNPKKYPLCLNYGCSQGSPNLTKALKDFYIKFLPDSFSKNTWEKYDLVVGANGTTSILKGAAEIFYKNNSTVFMVDPWYYIYSEFLIRYGYKIVTVPEDGEGMKVDLLEKEIMRSVEERKEEPAYIYLPTISNPTSTILSNDRRKEIIRAVNKISEKIRRPIPVIFDNAYEFLVHQPDHPRLNYFLEEDKNGIVYNIGTLSKIMAPGLRIGYLIGKKGGFLKALTQGVCDSGFSASAFNQEIAALLINENITEIQKDVKKAYHYKAGKIEDFIREKLLPLGITYTGGQAGFYFYFTFPENIPTGKGTEFFKYISRTTGIENIDKEGDGTINPRVSIIPGEMCVNPNGKLAGLGKHQLRISYAFEDLGKIIRGLNIITEAVQYARKA